MIKTKTNFSYAYLLISFVFLFFLNGRWIIPIAAFLAPLFLIRFLRFHRPLKGCLLLILVGWVSNIFIWKEMMPVAGFFYFFLDIYLAPNPCDKPWLRAECRKLLTDDCVQQLYRFKRERTVILVNFRIEMNGSISYFSKFLKKKEE